MTLFHIENKITDNRHRYVEYHRIGGVTFCIDVDFYPNGIEYTEADISVLAEDKTWTELAEFTPDLWHAAAKAAEQGEPRHAVFKQVTGFLLEVGMQALGLVVATPVDEGE